MKSKREARAVDYFRNGLNCAQAVLNSYANELSFDADMALSVSCGFGGGMGRLQKTCGAVSGSFMVFGIYNCRKYPDNNDRKEKTYEMVQKFSDKFIAIHGSTDCKSLLNCDLRTEEGRKTARDNNLYEIVCEKCVSDSIRIIEDLMRMT